MEWSNSLHPVPRQLEERLREEEPEGGGVAGGAICLTCSSGLFIRGGGGEKWPNAFSQICKFARHATHARCLLVGICRGEKFKIR